MCNLCESRKNIGCIRDWHVKFRRRRHLISNIKCLHHHQQLLQQKRKYFCVAPSTVTIKTENSIDAAADWQTCNSGEIFNSLSFSHPQHSLRQYSIRQWQRFGCCQLTSTFRINTPRVSLSVREWTLPANYAIYNPCVGTIWANSIGWRKCEIYMYFAMLSTRRSGTIDVSPTTCYCVCCLDVNVEFYQST